MSMRKSNVIGIKNHTVIGHCKKCNTLTRQDIEVVEHNSPRPDRFVFVSLLLMPVYYAIEVMVYDVLGFPVWIFFWPIVVMMWSIKYNIYKKWVFR